LPEDPFLPSGSLPRRMGVKKKKKRRRRVISRMVEIRTGWSGVLLNLLLIIA
jgi:hypothetical protein